MPTPPATQGPVCNPILIAIFSPGRCRILNLLTCRGGDYSNIKRKTLYFRFLLLAGTLSRMRSDILAISLAWVSPLLTGSPDTTM